MLYKKYIILLSLLFIVEVSLLMHIFYMVNIVDYLQLNQDIEYVYRFYIIYITFVQLFYLFIFLILLPYKNIFLIKNTNLLYIYGGIIECLLMIMYLRILNLYF